MVVLARDTFTRTIPQGWGTADAGEEWTVTAGVAATSVNGSAAQIDHTNTLRNIVGNLGITPTIDIDVQVTWWVGGVPSGGAVAARVYARYNGSGADYHARVTVTPGTGAVNIGLYLADVAILKSPVDVGFAVTGPATKIVSRVQAIGSNPTELRGKTWRLGAPEPDWQVVATDSAAGMQGPSVPGMRIGLAGSTVAPFVSNFDDFIATDGRAALPAVVVFAASSTVGGEPQKAAPANVSITARSGLTGTPVTGHKAQVGFIAASGITGSPQTALPAAVISGSMSELDASPGVGRPAKVVFTAASGLVVTSSAQHKAAVTFGAQSGAGFAPQSGLPARATFATVSALIGAAVTAHSATVGFAAHGSFRAHGATPPIPSVRLLHGASTQRVLAGTTPARVLTGHAPTRSLKGAS